MTKKIFSLFTTALVLTSIASANSTDNNTAAMSKTYVLVHGAWQAPYVWDDVRAGLVKQGNNVIVVELPGHGADNTPLHTLTLDAYRDRVIEAISTTKEKIILVGHSMAGMVITAVAEKLPSKIETLVYVSAFLPTSGQALTDLAYADPYSKLGPAIQPSADQLTLNVQRESLVELFIADGQDSVKGKVLNNYRGEPAIPFTNKVVLTAEGFGSVKKVYIKTLKDIVISPQLQDRMIAGAGITEVYTLNTSHSPFLSQPVGLAQLLVKVGK